jgi:hypothetical protein
MAAQRDWWDALYQDEDTGTRGKDTVGDSRDTAGQQVKAPAWDTQDTAGEQPQDAGDSLSLSLRLTRRQAELGVSDHLTGLARHALPAGIRTERLAGLAYNGGAAYAGWLLGLAGWMSDGIEHYGQISTQRGVWVGVGLVLMSTVLEVRTRALRDPGRHAWVRFAGWITRIPAASAVLALALYSAPL